MKESFPISREISTPAMMEELGKEIASWVGAGDVVVLSGPLGAGKTTLTRGIGLGLGVDGPVTSPTFVIAREHKGAPALIHVDAYRLGSALELDDLDLDLARAVTVVEWGSGLVEPLAPTRLEVSIDRGDDDFRQVSIVAVGGFSVKG